MNHFKVEYTEDWKEVSRRTKARSGWRCIRCKEPNNKKTNHVLTVHHFDGDKENNKWWNLLALCQRCHLSFQARVNPEVPWMFEHSEWLKPYVAGFYAMKYLRDELLNLERMDTDGESDMLAS